MAIIWVILFPLGAIIIRFLQNKMSNAVGKHRLVQISTLVLLLVAGGIGIYLARGHQFTLFRILRLSSLKLIEDHFFGIGIIAAAIIQACFGGYHHYRFVRDRPTHRRWFTHVHLWLGRTVILCGLANCGFGLIVAGRPTSSAIIWWICSGALAGLYFFFYVCVAIVRRRREKWSGKGTYTPPGAGPTRYGGAGEGYEMNPYTAPTAPLVGQAAVPGYYTPPRFEPDRTREVPGPGERYMDEDPEPYDPPRRQFQDTEPVQRYGSPSGRKDLP